MRSGLNRWYLFDEYWHIRSISAYGGDHLRLRPTHRPVKKAVVALRIGKMVLVGESPQCIIPESSSMALDIVETDMSLIDEKPYHERHREILRLSARIIVHIGKHTRPERQKHSQPIRIREKKPRMEPSRPVDAHIRDDIAPVRMMPHEIGDHAGIPHIPPIFFLDEVDTLGSHAANMYTYIIEGIAELVRDIEDPAHETLAVDGGGERSEADRLIHAQDFGALWIL